MASISSKNFILIRGDGRAILMFRAKYYKIPNPRQGRVYCLRLLNNRWVGWREDGFGSNPVWLPRKMTLALYHSARLSGFDPPPSL